MRSLGILTTAVLGATAVFVLSHYAFGVTPTIAETAVVAVACGVVRLINEAAAE
jgi:hypothetical protein